MEAMPGARDGGTNAPAGWRGLLTFHVDPRRRPGRKVKVMEKKQTVRLPVSVSNRCSVVQGKD